MNQQDVFSSTQIITFNPILKETVDVRVQYFIYLKKLINFIKCGKRKYTKAQISFYEDTLCDEKKAYNCGKNASFDARFCYLLPFDLIAMLGFRAKVVQSGKIDIVINKITTDFCLSEEQSSFLLTEVEAALGKQEAWNAVLDSRHIKGFKRYLRLVKENIEFMMERPYNIFITATMSAGKSTLINSLVGKRISLTQNMACTSKIHTIISKAFDDGVTSEYDSELSLDASHEDLLNDNEDNRSYKITVGTYFNGNLGGKRLILFDSPGVNSSENAGHTIISQRVLKSRKYRLIIYVLNSTQLGTTDEEQHLEAVRQSLGRAKIIFVMNKTDQLISDDDNFLASIENQRNFLISKGFKKPIICPVSSRAAFLAKKSRSEKLERTEQRELYIFMDKFEEQHLSDYYERALGCPHISSNNENDTLLVNCGFAHFERIILNLINGGKTNGTDIC